MSKKKETKDLSLFPFIPYFRLFSFSDYPESHQEFVFKISILTLLMSNYRKYNLRSKHDANIKVCKSVRYLE